MKMSGTKPHRNAALVRAATTRDGRDRPPAQPGVFVGVATVPALPGVTVPVPVRDAGGVSGPGTVVLGLVVLGLVVLGLVVLGLGAAGDGGLRLLPGATGALRGAGVICGGGTFAGEGDVGVAAGGVTGFGALRRRCKRRDSQTAFGFSLMRPPNSEK
mgnify:CR=1 FL=1